MNVADAAKIADLMCQMWAAPELGDDGIRLLVVAISDTGLQFDEAQVGLRVLMQESHRFRPQMHDLVQASRPRPVAAQYHRPFAETAGELPPAPPDRTVGRAALAEMRALMAAAKREGAA